MRGCVSILLPAWVFVIAPGICLGAIGIHEPECDHSRCADCTSSSHEGSHDCRYDPCLKDALRTESEYEKDAVSPVWPTPITPDAHSPAGTLSCLLASTESLTDHAFNSPAGTRLRTLAGLPLLI